MVRQARIKSVCAKDLGVNRKNISREWKQLVKDRGLKQQVEAAHQQHPAYGHRMAKFNLRPPWRRIKRYCTVSTPHHTYHNLLKTLTIT